MLKCVLVVGDIVVVVVGIGEKSITIGKHVRGAQVWCWQLCLMGLLDDEHILGVVGKVFA